MKKCALFVLASLTLTPGPAPVLAAPLFGAKADFPTGIGPYSVAIGDLNGDGKADLAVAGGIGVSVLLNTGNGIFGTKTDFPTAGSPTSVAIGDLNGDGRPDLVVANSGSNTVSVLLGNGDGTFAARTDFGTGSTPMSVAIGDLNGDAKPDLAVANYGSNSVSVLLGSGTGTFAAKTDFVTGNTPVSVAIADLNGDGLADLGTANYTSSSVSVLLGSGGGTFGPRTDFATGSFPACVAIGDLNADGRPDLATANYLSNTASVLLGNGDGTFLPRTDFAAGGRPRSIAIRDLDGDGKPDLAVANYTSNSVSVLLGIGDGTFAAKADFVAGLGPYSVAIGDLDGDAKPDLALANSGGNTVSVLLRQSIPSSTSLGSSPSPSVAGQAVLLTATVSPSDASGSVEFREGASVFGTSALVGGVATLTVPSSCGGSYSFSAAYTGDPGHGASTSPTLAHVVNPAPTTVTVISSPNPSRISQAVSFTATVSDAGATACALTGTVQFVIDGVAFGTPVALAGGSATLNGITSLASGPHTVQALYAGNTSFLASTSPTITHEVELPRPGLVGVRDLVNDQGGQVKLLWNASYLDLAPYNSLESYWVLRAVPLAVFVRATGAGAHVSYATTGPIDAQPGAFLVVQAQGTTYTWEFIASQPAFHVTNYSYVAATTRDSVAGSNPFTTFMIMARTAGGALSWTSDPDSGYSVDNLAPRAPTPFTGTYAAGVASLHWGRSPEADLALYRLHRGVTADFVPDPGNLVVSQPDTGYADVVSGLYHYKLCAVDIHGNASGFTWLRPSGTSDVADGSVLAFALESVRPNPSRGGQLGVSFTLPTSAPARLELLDVSGRRVVEREVGTLGAGLHRVALAGDRSLAPGLYLVRLTQGANVRVTRVAVLK